MINNDNNNNRTHIGDLGVPAGRRVYLTNTLPRFGLEGFLGAIEILSKRAVEVESRT